MINVLFFASLRERLGCESLTLDYQPEMKLDDIKNQLMAKGDNWQNVLSGNVLAAIDQEMVQGDAEIHDNAEIAFFPPVTGG